MSTTVNNNETYTFTRLMKESMFSSNTASRNQPSHDNSDTDSGQSDDETSVTNSIIYIFILSVLKHAEQYYMLTLIKKLRPSSQMQMIDIDKSQLFDSLKLLLLMSTESAIVLAVNAQASLSRVRRNNIAKEIYGSEVLLPIKIKDTPKMFDETETERVRKLAKSIRKNKEAKQSLLKMNNHSKSNLKKSVNSSRNKTYVDTSNNT
ncbi:hypothetical protein ACTFIZ_002946 [Dictyostelium cf. discoideum]